MSNIPGKLKYTASHEWAEVLADGTIKVGVTDHAQSLLGDMVYVELPQIGRNLEAGKECAVVESVKAASDVYAPIGGKVVEVNSALTDAPELINKDCYGAGWIMRIQPNNAAADTAKLLDAAAYTRVAESDAH